MVEFECMSGKIEKVYDNVSRDGKPYKKIILDNGEKFSLWRKGDFDLVSKGAEIAFDYSTNGQFKNIERIYDDGEIEDSAGSPDNGATSNGVVDAQYKGAGLGNGGGSAHNNGNGYDAKKIEQMARMSGLKSAAQIAATCGAKISFEAKVDKTLEAARKFKGYICQGDELGLEEPPEPAEPAG